MFQHRKSLGEEQEERERLEAEDSRLGAELSVAQKRVAIKRLRERGLTPKHFGGNFKKILQWLRTH